MPSVTQVVSALGAPTTAVAWVAAAVLVVAGAAKVRTPGATSRALRLAGLPDDERLVRLLGAGEVALGLAALLAVPFATLGVGAAYVAFTVFAVRQRRDPAADCGCFGTDATPLTRLHVVVDVALALGCVLAIVVTTPVGLVATGAVAAPPVGSVWTAASAYAVEGPASLLGSQGVAALLVAVVVLAAATWLVRVLLVDLPRVADLVVRARA